METWKYSPQHSPTENLYALLEGKLPEQDIDPEDLPQLEKLLLTITHKEEKVIRMRCAFGYEYRTFVQIGAEFNVTASRARGIFTKALCKLKHPTRSEKIKALFITRRELKDRIKERDAHIGLLELRIKDLEVAAQRLQKEQAAVQAHLSSALAAGSFYSAQLHLRSAIEIWSSYTAEAGDLTLIKTIEDLDFSCRIFNCLKRIGINTLGDIAMLSEDDCRHIRNLGFRSLEEIKAKLAEYGLSLRKPED